MNKQAFYRQERVNKSKEFQGPDNYLLNLI